MSQEINLKERLLEAREARGFTADDLAERLDTTRQVVLRYESGKAFPRAETFLRLCAALNVLPEFFTLPAPAPEAAPLFFRHFRSKTPKKQISAVKRRLLWLRDFIAAIEELVVLPTVDIPDFKPPSDPNLITNEQIEEAATALRRAWGFGDGVIIEIGKLLENKGCIVVSGLVNSDTIDAFSLWTRSGRPLIAANSRPVGAAHARLDLAHELGHLVLHRNVDRRFVESNPESHQEIEDQAFRFGSAFLMPEQTFRRSVPYVSLDTLLMAKPQWQLSVAAMLHRACDLGMVDQSLERNLWINLTRRGWKKREPLDDALVREEPKLLRNALLTIQGMSDGSIAGLGKRLGLGFSDYEGFAGLASGALGMSSIREFNPTPRENKPA